jgi:hypothetical protein
MRVSEITIGKANGVVLLALAVMGAVGCTNREYTRTPRTGTEQLLLSQALERSMDSIELPSVPPATVAVEVIGFAGQRQMIQPGFLSAGPMVNSNTSASDVTESTESNLPVIRPMSPDLEMVRGFVEGRLAQLGYVPAERQEDANLRIRVLVLALGTDQGQSFFGMPAIQSSIIPFSTPPLTIYQAQRQIAYARYRLQIYDARTRNWHAPSQWYEGLAYYNQYTVFFFFSFRGTDLVQAPQLQ